ncbi:MAG: hypothetical protein ABJ308_05825 [Halieaceae bacterium]
MHFLIITRSFMGIRCRPTAWSGCGITDRNQGIHSMATATAGTKARNGAKAKKASARKTTAKKSGPRKVTSKSATAKSATAKKATAKKATARKATAKKAATKKPAQPEVVVKAQENARNVFLAGLGAYGKAFEEAQSQIEEAQSRMKENRARAEGLFKELVKRGEKVESSAKEKIKTLDLPEVKMPELKLVDHEQIRKQLEARLDRARKSFDSLRDAIASQD